MYMWPPYPLEPLDAATGQSHMIAGQYSMTFASRVSHYVVGLKLGGKVGFGTGAFKSKQPEGDGRRGLESDRKYRERASSWEGRERNGETGGEGACTQDEWEEEKLDCKAQRMSIRGRGVGL